MFSDLSSAEAEALTDQLVTLRQQIDELELRWSRLAARLAASGHHEEMGSQNASDFLRHRCRMGEGAARDRLAVGRHLDRLYGSACAMLGGKLGFGHLVVMARTAGQAPDQFDEQPLLARAVEESVNRFWHTCQHYLHVCNPEAVAEEAEELFEQRELNIRRRRDGMYTVWGRMDAVGAATWRAALAPMARRQGRDDSRTHPQRLHDAVVEHAARNQVTHLNVTVAADTLAGLACAPAGEIEGIQPVAMGTVERLACDSTVRRIVLGPKSLVVDVGRKQRVVSAAGRRAVVARDAGRCACPGCDRAGTAVHHLQHWARGGSTDVSNQALLCYWHHRMCHEGGYRMIRNEAGEIILLRPPPRFAARPAA